ncbi:MAG: helix-turn-helix transcriptional regulator [Flavobacteriales bacterium]
MTAKAYCDKIRQVRRFRGYGQEYMAVQLGMSCQKQYSRYETGESKLYMDLLVDIAAVLDMSLPALLQFDLARDNWGNADAISSKQPQNIAAMDSLQGVLMDRIRHLEAEVEYLRLKLDQAMRQGWITSFSSAKFEGCRTRSPGVCP